MSSFDFDSVKAEKADAIRRFNRNRICVFCFRLVGALSLLCSSFTYFPVVKEISSGYMSVLNQQLYVLVLINALIFVIYHMSSAATSTSNNNAVSQHDFYDQYVSLSSASCRRKEVAEEEKQLVVSRAVEIQADESWVCENQIVHYENADAAPAEENPVRDLTVSDSYKAGRDQEMHFRRTQSQKYRVLKSTNIQRKELRRSETENGRELMVVGGNFPATKPMQEMNNEEFRLTIERFIASTKKILRDENFAVSMEEREKSFTAIAYK